jgi:hypothetical protein
MLKIIRSSYKMIDFDLVSRVYLQQICVDDGTDWNLGFQRCIALPGEGDTAYAAFPPLLSPLSSFLFLIYVLRVVD